MEWPNFALPKVKQLGLTGPWCDVMGDVQHRVCAVLARGVYNKPTKKQTYLECGQQDYTHMRNQKAGGNGLRLTETRET